MKRTLRKTCTALPVFTNLSPQSPRSRFSTLATECANEKIVAESISDGSSKILLKSKKASPKKVTSRSKKDNLEFFKDISYIQQGKFMMSC
ncbi:hypothetical protein pipiens_008803 [Culex pipiens pipiens]|uniref:Uncharacterized protein n=1 Tax=Culex pipiens pipiens TaxID=38569 RepID=A0ABD1DG27_CULPP